MVDYIEIEKLPLLKKIGSIRRWISDIDDDSYTLNFNIEYIEELITEEKERLGRIREEIKCLNGHLNDLWSMLDIIQTNGSNDENGDKEVE